MRSGLFVSFEDSMTEHYAGLIAENDLQVFSYSLDNYQGNLLSTLLYRIQVRREVADKTSELECLIRDNGIKTLFFASAEGFLGMNAIPAIRKRLPDLHCISLQHGLFALRYDPITNLVRRLLNAASSLLWNLHIIGLGFGGVRTDRYVVFGKRERDFLISKRGWDESSVTADIGFLKPHLKHTEEEPEGDVVFFLQALAHVGLCTKAAEDQIVANIVKYLAHRYDSVLIKEHPKFPNAMKNIDLPPNVRVFDESRMPRCRIAYSFFSTALLEAELVGMEIAAVRCRQIKVKSSVYQLFDNVLSYEKEILPSISGIEE